MSNAAEDLSLYCEQCDDLITACARGGNHGPWSYKDAPEDVKAAILEKNRNYDVEESYWSETTQEDFKDDMKEKGIEVQEIYFSGFWSQGDGACFEGRIDDLELFINSHYEPGKFPTIRQLLALDGSIYFSCEHSGHYYHSHSVSFNFEAEDWEQLIDYDEDDLRFHVLEALMIAHEDELQRFENEAAEIFRDHMNDLYEDLEAEYDYLTSDEYLEERLEGNGEQYDEDGEEV